MSQLGTCPKCGTKNAYAALNCIECGARLPWADALQQQTQPAPPPTAYPAPPPPVTTPASQQFASGANARANPNLNDDPVLTALKGRSPQLDDGLPSYLIPAFVIIGIALCILLFFGVRHGLRTRYASTPSSTTTPPTTTPATVTTAVNSTGAVPTRSAANSVNNQPNDSNSDNPPSRVPTRYGSMSEDVSDWKSRILNCSTPYDFRNITDEINSDANNYVSQAGEARQQSRPNVAANYEAAALADAELIDAAAARSQMMAAALDSDSNHERQYKEDSDAHFMKAASYAAQVP